MAALLAEDAPERGYKPVPAPRWHELSQEQYEEEVARLRAWVDEVFRPLYGHVAAGLHDCWPRHPLTLVLLDYLAETWKVLHLRRSRSAQILGTQLEFQLRYLPAAAEMLTEDMRQCARVHQVPGSRPAEGGVSHDRLTASGTATPREAAHTYAEHGWPVFPCQEGSKEPATEHGFQDATTDHGQIDKWWSRGPERNVAVATGAPGPDVVDVDNHGERGNGFAAWNKAQHEGLVRDPLAIVQTPSGGLHAYFKGTEQRSAKIPGQHLDFRAQGGYVVAPPSRARRPPVRGGQAPAERGHRRFRRRAQASGAAARSGRRSACPHAMGGRATSATWPAGSPTCPRETGTTACSGPPTGRLRRATGRPWTPSRRPPGTRAWPSARSTGPSGPRCAAPARSPEREREAG